MLSEFISRITSFLQTLQMKDVAYYIFFLLMCLACIITYSMFYDIDFYNLHSKVIVSTLYIDVALILIFLLICGRKLLKLWNCRNNKGSHITFRLISIFALISIIPSALMCIFSALFFHNGVESWFTKRNQVVLEESVKIAEAYVNEYKKNTLNECVAIARAVEYQVDQLFKTYPEPYNEFFRLNEVLNEFCSLKNIDAAILLDEQLNIVAHSKYSVSLHFFNLTYKDIQSLENFMLNSKILDISNGNKIIAASYFHSVSGNMYLLIEKTTESKIFDYALNANKAYKDYRQLLNDRNFLEILFILIFCAVGVLLLFGSITVAVIYSWKLVQPISNLINVSENIIDGDLSARASEDSSYAELQLLSRTFNQMLSQVSSQQVKLMKMNEELDERMQFTNNVLAGISSGVIGLDNNSAYIWNEAAEKLLGRSIVFGEHIGNLIPQLSELPMQLDDNIQRHEIYYTHDKNVRLFSLRIAPVMSEHKHRFVITFDDLTDMIEAERQAAWAEVARRVAHEIKNPLTPIQLAAERLKRKYISKINDDVDIFSSLIDVIVRQVGNIKRLSEEFNFFARLPEAQFKECDFFEIVEQAIVLMQNTAEAIQIVLINHTEEKSCFIKADERLLHQAILNILQNAINALALVTIENKMIFVHINKTEQAVLLTIEDNGPGLPQEKIDLLTTPYFSLTPKGTGLGLSIVKKIVSEHKGELSFANGDIGGARVTLTIPIGDTI